MVEYNAEIERRWLLSGMPSQEELKDFLVDHRNYLTGYIYTGDPELRVRQTYVVSGPKTGQSFFSATLKFGEGLEREELIFDIDPDSFFRKMKHAVATIQKTRYRIKVGELVWEIDRFTKFEKPPDSHLFLAEVELKSKDQNIVFPQFLTPYIVKEVTEDPQYFNKNLAILGVPSRHWKNNLTAEQMRLEKEIALNRIQLARECLEKEEDELRRLQSRCQHPDMIIIPKQNFTLHTCGDCGKEWSTRG